MTCLVDQRQRAHHAAATIDADERVVSADVVPPAQDPMDRFVVDVLLSPQCAGLPTDIFGSLAFDVTIRDVSPQADHTQAMLLV